MPTEQEIIDGTVNASDDTDAIDIMIQNLYNEIMKKRMRIIQLHREKKSQEASELEEMCDNMESEMNSMIKSQLNYIKYLKAIGKGGNNQQPTGVSKEIKNQKSSNGQIVAEIPKH